MRHSEPAPLPLEQLIQPTADNKPTLGLHAHTHRASQKTKPMMSQAHSYTSTPLQMVSWVSELFNIFATPLFLCKR